MNPLVFCLSDIHVHVHYVECFHSHGMLDSGSSGPGSSPGQEHCVVFLGKTLYSHSAYLHPGV